MALPPSGPTSLDGGARLRGAFSRAGLLRCRAGIASEKIKELEAQLINKDVEKE